MKSGTFVQYLAISAFRAFGSGICWVDWDAIVITFRSTTASALKLSTSAGTSVGSGIFVTLLGLWVSGCCHRVHSGRKRSRFSDGNGV